MIRTALKSLLGLVLLILLALAVPWPIFVGHQDVQKIENLVADNACVGDIDMWSREYRFHGHESFTPNFQKISFIYWDPSMPEPDGTEREFGIHTPWKQSALFGQAWLDDREQRVVSGSFNRKTGKIEEWFCGCNASSLPGINFPVCDAPITR